MTWYLITVRHQLIQFLLQHMDDSATHHYFHHTFYSQLHYRYLNRSASKRGEKSGQGNWRQFTLVRHHDRCSHCHSIHSIYSTNHCQPDSWILCSSRRSNARPGKISHQQNEATLSFRPCRKMHLCFQSLFSTISINPSLSVFFMVTVHFSVWWNEFGCILLTFH